MGSPTTDQGGRDDEKPLHRVTIAEPFAVGVYEVTVGEFRDFVTDTGHQTGDSCVAGVVNDAYVAVPGKGWQDPGFHQNDQHPVVCVSWDDAQAYVRWLSRETGEYYRLLSESEWEYVARARTTTARYWGDDRVAKSSAEQCRHANLADRRLSYRYSVTCDDGYEYTAPVGSYTPNGYGLYDVLGNVDEWTQDCYILEGSYEGAPNDGSAWEEGNNCHIRMIRGGSWHRPWFMLRSAGRYHSIGRDYNVGIRVARTL